MAVFCNPESLQPSKPDSSILHSKSIKFNRVIMSVDGIPEDIRERQYQRGKLDYSLVHHDDLSNLKYAVVIHPDIFDTGKEFVFGCKLSMDFEAHHSCPGRTESDWPEASQHSLGALEPNGVNNGPNLDIKNGFI